MGVFITKLKKKISMPVYNNQRFCFHGNIKDRATTLIMKYLIKENTLYMLDL